MRYIDYINLGFIRVDTNDKILFDETGYYGFYLSKNLVEGISIEFYCEDLMDPCLYIEKKHKDQYHIINITPEMVKDLIEIFK